MATKKKSERRGKNQPRKPAAADAAQTAPVAAANPIEISAENIQPQTDERFPIVGIGASAGGLAAFEAFFSAMPAGDNTGMAFVLVQHLSPDHKSILRDLVKRYTSMQVYEVENGMKVEPNCTYIIPPNRDMAFLHGTLQLLEPSAPRGLRLPVDFFFRSLAQDQRERAICIVLSGSGSDGTLGVRAIKGEGGMIMAQHPDSTEHDGMPRSAIATGLVDYILPPHEMPAQLIAYVTHAFGKPPRPATGAPSETQEALKKLYVLLRAQTKHDFSQYKENTIVRRIERRMALHQITRMTEYVRYAQQNPAEVEALFRDLLIGVTNFFRDPDAFAVLKGQAIPRLFAGKPAGTTVRVWVCGCSTGEEAYSIAILFQEYLDTIKQSYKVQIFSTDVDKRAIEQARTGIFPVSIAADVSPERLARFFTQDGPGVYRIQKSVRDMVVFSEQDVIRDPPFSKLDLISCRNLLIYLNGELQKKLIPLFHYALNPQGILFLGPSETVGEFNTLFEAMDRKWKIFLRKRDVPATLRPPLGNFVPPLSETEAHYRPARAESRAEAKLNLRELTEQALLRHYVEAAIVVTGRGEILHIFGRTGRFLEPAAGDAGLNILPMAREGLRRELATALHRAVARNEAVRHEGLRVRTNGDFATVNLTVEPVSIPGGSIAAADLFLVIIDDAPPPPEPAAKDAGDGARAPSDADARVAALEQDLRAKDEYIQTTLEEMETSNEELKSTNEEMQSVNEELQSTNEELETSKEELQSVNEELATVNAELQAKVADLSRVNNDMNNLMASTGVGTLFIDHQLNIARFTPATTQVINLIQSDIGRPLAHIVSNLVGYDHLVEDVRGVLATLQAKEAEVRSKSGAWYLMRVRPYRTVENVIEGAVITFVDITDRKRAEELFRQAVESAPNAVVMVDGGGRIVLVNAFTEQMFDYRRDELIGNSVEMLVPERLRGPHRSLRQGFFAEPRIRTSSADLELYGVRRDGSEFPVEIALNPLDTADGPMVLSAVIDITERKRMETALRESEARLAEDLEAMTRLQRIGSLYVGEDNQQKVLDEIVETALAITGADMADVQLIDRASGRLEVVAQRRFSQAWLDFWKQSDEKPRAGGAALVLGERVIVADIASSPIFAGKAELEAQLAAGVRALQSTPLVERTGHPVGVLSTYFRTAHRPGERDLRLLDLLAVETANIVERGQTEEKAQRMAVVVRDSNDAVTLQYLDGRIVAWNRGAERLYGWSEAEALAMNILETVPAERRGEYHAMIRRIESGEAVEMFETQRIAKDGRVVDVRLTISTLSDETGKPVSISTTERSITGR